METPLTPVRVSQTGVAASDGSAADLVNGNTVPNLAALHLLITNAGEASLTVTFETSASVEGYAVADVTATVPAGASRAFGKFSRALFGDAVDFTCSAAATVVAYS